MRIAAGDAFGLVGEWRETDRKSSQVQGRFESAVEIKPRNRKSEPIEVKSVEHLYGPNWQVLEKSDEFTKKDASTIEFLIALKPDEERVVTYRVRYETK